MKKWIIRIISAILLLVLFLFWLMYFSARPPVMTDPATLAGDGSTVNYCALPTLDGSGKMAADIAKGNTPGCGYDHFPLPILAECTEPLAEGADDIRGLWVGVAGGKGAKVGHVERVEQCGDRTVITTAGIIHDSGSNKTGSFNSNDTEGSVLFTIGKKEYCNRTSASMKWRNGKLDFNAFGSGPVVVRRYMEGEQLVWEYLDGSLTKMARLCTLPEAHKTPKPRGRRFSFFAD